jgi:hypothetical protein
MELPGSLESKQQKPMIELQSHIGSSSPGPSCLWYHVNEENFLSSLDEFELCGLHKPLITKLLGE